MTEHKNPALATWGGGNAAHVVGAIELADT